MKTNQENQKTVMKTNLLYFGIGTIIIVIASILINSEITLLADKITIAGIIINALIAFLIVNYFQNKESNSRSLKDYFINEVTSLKTDYDSFIKGLKNSKFTSNEIKKEFKDFSIRNEQIEYFLKKEIKIQTIYIQDQNRKIHKLITNSFEFNNLYDTSNFILSSSNNNELLQLHKEFNHHLTSIVISINKT
jgi:hypothetical protein